MAPPHPPKRSPFITKSLAQRLKEQDRLISSSSIEQLQKNLESCRKTLSCSTFPEASESAVVLKQFESKLLIRLKQLSDSPPMSIDEHPQQGGSMGPDGIVGFKRQLIHEQSFVPKSESLMAPMSMSQSIKLQQQHLYRERELAATEALGRLDLQSTHHSRETNNPEEDGEEDDEMTPTANDQPDIQKAWEIAYQAGFSRGPGDLPQRILPAD